ncbi:MBL fold metallo-hydrolase [Pseudoalteromonas espejiana]
MFDYVNAIPMHLRWFETAKPNMLHVAIAYVSILLFWYSPFKRLVVIPLCVALVDYCFTPKPLWQLHVFDVGHGLMTLLEKDNNALVYDFGPSYFNRFSRTYSVLIPYIKAHNLKVSDAIISHQDNDHAGGLYILLMPDLKIALSVFIQMGIHNLVYLRSIILMALK